MGAYALFILNKPSEMRDHHFVCIVIALRIYSARMTKRGKGEHMMMNTFTVC